MIACAQAPCEILLAGVESKDHDKIECNNQTGMLK